MMKRGVSPLIATVLLVMIVVSIGAAVMLVIRGISNENIEKIQTKTSEIACGSDVSLGVLTVGNYYQICSNTTYDQIQVIMINKGTIDVDDFKITAVGSSGIYDNSTNSSIYIAQGETKYLTFDYSSTNDVGTLRQIKFAPIIAGSPGRENVICIDGALTYDASTIDDCPFRS